MTVIKREDGQKESVRHTRMRTEKETGDKETLEEFWVTFALCELVWRSAVWCSLRPHTYTHTQTHTHTHTCAHIGRERGRERDVKEPSVSQRPKDTLHVCCIPQK